MPPLQRSRQALRKRFYADCRFAGNRFGVRPSQAATVAQEPIETQDQPGDWLNHEIARQTGTDWDKRGFHMQDPPIVKLRQAAGTHAFYDPPYSMTNKSGTGRVTSERAAAAR